MTGVMLDLVAVERSLSQLREEIADAPDRAAATQLAADAAFVHLDCAVAFVGLVGNDARLHLSAMVGDGVGGLAAWPVGRETPGPIGATVRSRRSEGYVDEDDRHRRYPDWRDAAGDLAAMLTLPISASGGQFLGLVGAGWPDRHVPTEIDRWLLTHLADMVGSRLSSEPSGDGGQEPAAARAGTLASLEQEAAEEALDAIKERLGDGGAVCLTSDLDGTLRPLAIRLDPPEAAQELWRLAHDGILPDAAVTSEALGGKTLVVNDIPEQLLHHGLEIPPIYLPFHELLRAGAVVTAPVISEGRTAALIVVMRNHEIPFADDEVQAIEAVAAELSERLHLIGGSSGQRAASWQRDATPLAGRWPSWVLAVSGPTLILAAAARSSGQLSYVPGYGLLVVTALIGTIAGRRAATGAAVVSVIGLAAIATGDTWEAESANSRAASVVVFCGAAVALLTLLHWMETTSREFLAAQSRHAANREMSLARELEARRSKLAGAARYRSLVEATSALVWFSGGDGGFEKYQPGWAAFTGQRWSQQAGWGWLDAVHGDDRPAVHRSWANAVERGTAYEARARIWHRPSGTYHLTILRAAPIRSTDGAVTEWVGTVTDRQDQHDAEVRAGQANALLESAMGAAPVGFAFFDRDLRILAVNKHLAQVLDRTSDELVGLAFPGELRPPTALGDTLREVLESGRSRIDLEIRGLPPTRGADDHDWLISAFPVQDGLGELLGAGITVVDVTDRNRLLHAEHLARRLAEAAAERAQALQQIASALGAAVTERNLYETLGNDVRKVLGASTVSLGLVDADAGLVRLHGKGPSVAGRDDDVLAPLGEITPLTDAVRTGALVVLASADEFDQRYGHLRDHRRRASVEAVVALPLSDEDSVVGAVEIGFLGIPFFADEDLLFFDTAAKLIVQAFRRCRLHAAEQAARTAAEKAAVSLRAAYKERDQVARTLQRSLLPPELPDVPGAEVAARYLPAVAGGIGGDFYDLFETRSGQWHLVLGDVCGKGTEAAAVTALARHTIRAAAMRDDEPEVVLRTLNEAVLRSGKRFCTVAHCLLTPGDGGLHARLTLAGHPRPRLVGPGGVVPVGHHGTLMGALPQPRLTEAAFVIPFDSALVLYTDGVVERAPSFGEAELDGVLAAQVGPSMQADGVARAVEGAVGAAVLAAEAARADDVAVVVVRAVR